MNNTTRTYDKRKIKRRVRNLYKKLATNSFAIGCRGHPGVVVDKCFSYQDIHGAEVGIVSLMDGVESSCSVFHCSPDPICGDYARWLMVPFNYEADRIVSSMKWAFTFTDFDKFYNELDLSHSKDDISTHIEILKRDYAKTDDEFIICDNLSILLTELRYGGDVVDKCTRAIIGYTGETYRYNRSPRPDDFATPKELEMMSELYKKASETKSFYKSITSPSVD